MHASFGIFFSKRKHHNPRSHDPTRRCRPERSAGEGSQFGCQAPALLSITAKPDQFNDGSAAGEIDRQVESPPGLESPVLTKTPPGLHGTQRFFVSVGQSNSLLEEASMAKWPSDSHLTTTDIIPVTKYSTDPRSEFRRSMEEMVRWRLEQNLAVDWDYLVELFMCYVRLNKKEARKYILKAFVDLLVPLRQSHRDTPATPRRNSANGIRR